MPRYEVTLRFRGDRIHVCEADDEDEAVESAFDAALNAFGPGNVEVDRVVEVDAYEGEPRGTD